MIWLLYLVDQWGRRILLMIGSAGGAVCMYYIGAYIAVADPESSSTHTVDAGGKSAGKSGSSVNELCLILSLQLPSFTFGPSFILQAGTALLG